jgi:hypothetical protein
MEMDMRFGTWNVRSMYRADSLTAAARELARYKLVLVENPGVDGRIILGWIFRKWDLGAWTGSM